MQSVEFPVSNAGGNSHNYGQVVMNANFHKEQLILKTMIAYVSTYGLCFGLPYDHDGA
jgi:hypothetical protein